MKLSIYTDGGARGNPGPAGIGVVIYRFNPSVSVKKRGKKPQTLKWEKLGEYKEFIGETTNNQAEYRAVILGLERAKELGGSEIDMYMDSQLVSEQLNQKYKVKNKGLQPLFVKVWNLSIEFEKVKYHYIPRAKNKEADALVNEAIDQALG
jgi:ribonuclease HI